MKKGKITESVLKRSVLKYIHKEQNSEIIKGAGIGEDCALFEWKETGKGLGISTQTVTLPVKEAVRYAINAAVNNLAAGGAEAAAVTLAITLPAEGGTEMQRPDTPVSPEERRGGKPAGEAKFLTEKKLQEIMKQADSCCRELGIVIAGGHTESSDRVRSPVITATAFGKQWEQIPAQEQREVTGLSVVMTKWAGLEGTVILAREKESELLTRYSLSFLKQAQDFDRYLSLIPEAATALRSGVHTMHDMRNGGVFGALWELSQRLGVGLSVDLKKIPVKQETIEICEFYDLNPYELLSGGSLLLVTGDGEGLVRRLAEEGIFAAVIGQTTGNNDKVLLNEEETRFLEPAKPDEIFKINWNDNLEWN